MGLRARTGSSVLGRRAGWRTGGANSSHLGLDHCVVLRSVLLEDWSPLSTHCHQMLGSLMCEVSAPNPPWAGRPDNQAQWKAGDSVNAQVMDETPGGLTLVRLELWNTRTRGLLCGCSGALLAPCPLLSSRSQQFPVPRVSALCQEGTPALPSPGAHDPTNSCSPPERRPHQRFVPGKYRSLS